MVRLYRISLYYDDGGLDERLAYLTRLATIICEK
jgi:hypothetical protein